MDPEKKEESSEDFGKVIDILHRKQKIPSLRTYQGDVSNFIKEKNESVISITVKEKHRDHLDEAVEKNKNEKTSSPNNFQINFTILATSIALLAGGALASIYIFNYLQRAPVVEIQPENELIPISRSVNLTNITKQSLKAEIAKLPAEKGITAVKISDTKGVLVNKSEVFFDLSEVATNLALRRTLRDAFLLGTFYQNEAKTTFVIVTVSDYGRAFSGMLEWEENLLGDLAFLNISTATNTSTSTPVQTENFVWKDLIVKNKDTRALANSKNQAKVAYTFLDKNTILITNSLSAIGEISSIYASRSVVR